jgi:DNA-binding transcriptional LysR family regulator
MSHALAKLRKLTGNPLFVRVPSGMEPTDFALRIAPSVNEGLKLLIGAVEGDGPFNPSRCDRTFQILMSDIGELVYLPSLLNRLVQVAPNLDLRVIQLPREAYQDALASGEAD